MDVRQHRGHRRLRRAGPADAPQRRREERSHRAAASLAGAFPWRVPESAGRAPRAAWFFREIRHIFLLPRELYALGYSECACSLPRGTTLIVRSEGVDWAVINSSPSPGRGASASSGAPPAGTLQTACDTVDQTCTFSMHRAGLPPRFGCIFPSSKRQSMMCLKYCTKCTGFDTIF